MLDKNHHRHWFHLVIGDEVYVVDWPWDALSREEVVEFNRGLRMCCASSRFVAFMRLQAYLAGWECRLGISCELRRSIGTDFSRLAA